VIVAVRDPLRRLGAGAGGRLRSSSYLQKWLVLGAAIGVIAGLGAVAFSSALTLASQALLGGLGGYDIPKTVSEGGALGSAQFGRWWAIPLIVCGGGLLSGVLVTRLAPEAEGHGTDAAIDAVHRNPRLIRSRAVIVKLVASAITIGSGGSGGREGPTAQISAGFGSLLARTLDLSPEDGRVAVSVGIGSGIGAIFGAPLGGAVLAADIVYTDDFEAEALIPGLIASVISYTTFGLIKGFTPMFGFAAPGYEFHDPMQLLWFAIIGVLCGGVGLVYAKGFYGIAGVAKRLPGNSIVKPAAGGLLVGLLALAIPQVLGTGYGWAQHALDRQQLQHLSLWIVLLLPFAKILATALSIGSGGSGGIFGPGTVIGGFVGAAVWRVLEPIAPAIPHSPAPFVIVGMMACFGAVAHAPLAMMLMVAEMTGNLTTLAPAMIAVGIAYLIVRRAGETIYRSQLRNRDEAREARVRVGMPLLGRVRVATTMTTPRAVLAAGTTVAAAAGQLEAAGVPGAPLVDGDGRFLGVVDTAELLRHRADAAGAPVERRVDATAQTVAANADVDQAVQALSLGRPWVTVLDDDRQVSGIIAVPDVVRGYRAALRSEARKLSRVSATADIVELRVGALSMLVGEALRDAQLPGGAIVVSIQRADALLSATAATTLRSGDLLTVLAPRDTADDLAALFDSAETADAAAAHPHTKG